MDPLSDILSLLKPRTYGAGGFDLAGEWSLQFPRHAGVKCYAVTSGRCWLSVEGLPEPVLLNTGDCILLTQGRPFRLASDLKLSPVPYTSLPRIGGVATCKGGGDCFIVGGHFALADNHARALLGVLAPVVHLSGESDRAALRWSLDRMRQELTDKQPGASLVAQHLAHLILVQALRLHVANESSGQIGWLFALADKRIGEAISAIHGDPAHPWTLELLARHAGMSRSGFALKFKELVGEAPIEYVTRWRMMIASDDLVNSSDSIAVIARSLGYLSESAFSTAFKRVMGCSPRRYGRSGTEAGERALTEDGPRRLQRAAG